jgi:hypothetical protein
MNFNMLIPCFTLGLSMSLDHTKDGCFYFKYEHNKEYRQIQYDFWEAVSSLNPTNIVALVNMYPYHIDSLIQLSDICRMSEDPQMAGELIERALYILESAFHPSFNLASGNCRLEYKQQENRYNYFRLLSFTLITYLVYFKGIIFGHIQTFGFHRFARMLPNCFGIL